MNSISASVKGWTVHESELGRSDVRDLLALDFAELRADSPPEAGHVLPIDGLRDPALTLFALREYDTLLGVGALKQLALGHGGLKSMRTDPAALGRGVGGAILDGLVTEARSRGYRRISLEIGNGPEFAAALRLYDRDGFTPCEPFDGYAPPFTRFLTRDLTAAMPRS